MRGAERSCRARGNFSHLHTFFSVPGGAIAKMRKKVWLRAIRNLLSSGTCRYRSRDYKGPTDAAQLAPEDLLARVHDSLEHKSLGHTWWSGWRPLPETSTEKLPSEPRRQHRAEHGLGVFQYNCESLRAPDRLHELVALPKRKGAAIACLQGTLFDGVSEWVNHGYRFFTQPQLTASK